MANTYRFALLAALLGGTSPAWAGERPWTVSEANGRVTVTDASGSRAATRGMIVPAGATLTTSAGARAVMTRGPEFVTVSANSRLRVPEAAQQSGIIQIIQDWGNALFKIDKQPNPHFGVKTPYLAAVVKGTTFSITVTKDGSSMQVVEGAVEVSTDDGGARELIRPGSVAMVAAGDRFRLSVQGAETRVIDSPVRADPPAEPAPVATPNPEPATPEIAASTSVDIVAEVIQAKPVDLGSVTGGLIGGNTAVVMAAATFAPAVNDVVEAARAPATEAPVTASLAVASVPVALVAEPVSAMPPLSGTGDSKVVDAIGNADKAARVDPAATAETVIAAKPEPAGRDVAPGRGDDARPGEAKGHDKTAEDAAKDSASAARDAEKAAHDADKAARDQAKAAEQAAKDADKAARETAKAAEDLAKAGSEPGKGAKDAEKDDAKVAEDLAKAQAKAADDAAKAAAKAADDAAKAAAKAADDAAKGKAAEDAAKEQAKAADDAAKAQAKAADDAAKAAAKAADDAAKAQAKAADDAAKAQAKAADDAAKAAAKAADDAAKAQAKAAEDMAKEQAKKADDDDGKGRQGGDDDDDDDDDD